MDLDCYFRKITPLQVIFKIFCLSVGYINCVLFCWELEHSHCLHHFANISGALDILVCQQDFLPGSHPGVMTGTWKMLMLQLAETKVCIK